MVGSLVQIFLNLEGILKDVESIILIQQDRVIFLVSNFIASNKCKIQKFRVVNKIRWLSPALGLIL